MPLRRLFPSPLAGAAFTATLPPLAGPALTTALPPLAGAAFTATLPPLAGAALTTALPPLAATRACPGGVRSVLETMRVPLAAIAVGITLTACGGDAPATPAVVVDTVAGAERLTYSAEPAGDLGWTVADTVAVIGDAMGDAAYHFARPQSEDLAGTADGGVLVADRDGTRVLEYGPSGAHRATYSREGEGPGELRFPIGLAVGPGDTVWVNDMRNRRLTGFPRGSGSSAASRGSGNSAASRGSGTSAASRGSGNGRAEPRSVPLPRGDVFPGSRVAALEDGFLIVMGVIGQAPGEAIPEPLLRTDRALQPLDTVWTRAPDEIDIVPMDLGETEIVLGMSQQYHPQFHWQALPDGGVVVADSADYVFRILSGDGSVRRIVRRGPPARATTDADREAARQSILREFSLSLDGRSPDQEMQRRMTEARAEAMTFHDRIPRIVDIRVDRQGRIWVGVSEDSAEVAQRIDVYDPDGTLLGELRDLPMPEAFTGGDRMITTRTDELDVPQVVVIRVAR